MQDASRKMGHFADAEEQKKSRSIEEPTLESSGLE